MREAVTFTVLGRPVPAARMTKKGKWTRPNAKRYLAYKDQVGWTARQYFSEPWGGPIGIRVVAYWYGGKPGDLDNILKAIQDGLNGIAYEDDTQVIKIEAERRQGRPQRAEVTIWREREEECSA